MATTRTRFDPHVPSERTGRLVLPAPKSRRACACCEMLVAKQPRQVVIKKLRRTLCVHGGG